MYVPISDRAPEPHRVSLRLLGITTKRIVSDIEVSLCLSVCLSVCYVPLSVRLSASLPRVEAVGVGQGIIGRGQYASLPLLMLVVRHAFGFGRFPWPPVAARECVDTDGLPSRILPPTCLNAHPSLSARRRPRARAWNEGKKTNRSTSPAANIKQVRGQK